MIYLSLGSNLGDRHFYLEQAITLLKKNILSSVESSRILETLAILPSNAPANWDLPYLNMIVRGETHLQPFDLLKELKQIERKLGRDLQALRWAPRIIDIDILLWNDEIIDLPELKVPHPAIKQRGFLQILLSEFE